ncbi:MAG: primosomal protein N', partial [Calditrichia bacterium]
MRKKSNAAGKKLTDKLREIYDTIPEEKWISLKDAEKKAGVSNILNKIQRLRKNELIEIEFFPPRQKKIFKTEEFFELNDSQNWPESAVQKYLRSSGNRKTKAQALITWLADNGKRSRREIRTAGFHSSVIKKLTDEKILLKSEVKLERTQENLYNEEHVDVVLTKSQQEFIEKVEPLISTPAFKPFLLHGITGSGKTHIYIELVKRVVATGRQAIVLVPEIVLTPQTMARFRNHFGDMVAVTHSRLSPGEKAEVLYKTREGRYKIILGPRSAIFSPLRNLGLIIVDEEHEASYKQNEPNPRYNARDVALYRAYLNNIPIVLGSATPSFESLYNAFNSKYEYFHLAYRVHSRNMPRTRLIDLRREWSRHGTAPLLSENLLLKTESRLVSREQIMLLQNRRGFSPYLLCKECGYIEKCPNCDITLTYHYTGKDLRCHYCGFSEHAPDVCPNCNGIDILFKGFGTQKIEQEVLLEFNNATVQRMDQDTTKGKFGHGRLLEKFRNGEIDILIGTKMIAKGLDFKRVSLVGIISADQGLNFPDFRASEKVFQLLTQASGRAGRGASSGEVIIQTYNPEHYIFRFLQNHNYRKFYETEIKSRKALNYPPFSRLCLIRIIGESEKLVEGYSRTIAKYLWKANRKKNFTVLGPAPAPLFKLNNQYRYQILIKQTKEIDESMAYVRQIVREG